MNQANVWESLEHAGKILLETTSNTTIDIVNHKYGEDAALATADGLTVAIDAIETAYTLNQLGVKKLAKRAAIHTGKQTSFFFLLFWTQIRRGIGLVSLCDVYKDSMKSSYCGKTKP